MNIPTGHINLSDLYNLFYSSERLTLSEDVFFRIDQSRNYLDHASGPNEPPIYGVNTGFGSLCDTRIEEADLSQLQKNLLISHACGLGEMVDTEITRLMLLLKVIGLSKGYSGVQRATVETLLDFYNNKLIPVVFDQGSLGASGDLAPLSHLCLPIIGLGTVRYNGEIISGQDALNIINRKPLSLKSKEGLALINGTQFMSSFAVYNVWRARHLFHLSTEIACLSLEAFDGRLEPFSQHLHSVRPHKGQKTVANQVVNNLIGSEIAVRQKKHVQDPYSFRCIPQVHGASIDALNYCSSVIETEVNSVTDNPVVFVDKKEVISGGHFHGQPLALVLDFLGIAAAEIGSISERRTYKLISGQRELPAFLSPNPGLNSGFMIAHYTAASIVSQNKQFCTPASIDTIDSSNGQEDHVSMGANAATKLQKIIDNLEKILGIEWITAAQALEFRRPLRSSQKIESLFHELRKEIPFLAEDQYLHPHLLKAQRLTKEKQSFTTTS
jgi:histidine ammonia-lyase